MLKLLSIDYKERLKLKSPINWSLTGLKLYQFTMITGLNTAGIGSRDSATKLRFRHAIDG